MLSSALLAFSLGPSSFSSGSVSSLDLETDDDLPSTPSPNPSLALLPPEVRRQILAEAFVGRYEPFLVDAQFQPVETLCRLCTFRTLSLVSREWHEVVQELFLREIVVEKQVQNEQLVGALRRDPRLGRRVRNLDASLRSLNNAMPELVSIDSSVAYVEAEAEGLRAASIDKDRDLLKELLELCPLLTTFDADFGFYNLRAVPCLLPNTIRTLTLRNTEPVEAFGIVACLPLLTDLTLRLVLDWYLAPDTTLVSSCQLERFELSITGWGETDMFTIKRLLFNSLHSLRSLTIRNKEASSVPAFLPIARDLITLFGPQLTSLCLKDVPNRGRRAIGEKPLRWFPLKLVACPRIRSLQLTGLEYNPVLFANLKCGELDDLCIEDFDNEDGVPLLASLAHPVLAELRSLRLSVAKDGWERSYEEVESVCKERGIALMAGWEMRRLERSWWW